MFNIAAINDLWGQAPNKSQLGDLPIQQDLFQALEH